MGVLLSADGSTGSAEPVKELAARCGRPARARGRSTRGGCPCPVQRSPGSGAEGEGERMGSYVLGLREIDQTQVAIVGGKGAHLGELSRIEGIRVPAGFCVTTDAFRRIMEEAPSI